MNKWFSVVLAAGILGGCAVAPEAPEQEPLTPQQALAAAGEGAPIDEEILYLLMAAELAGQRNQYDLAMDAYLQAAKRVDDPRIAERAVRIGIYLKDEARTREALNVWLSKDDKNVAARKFAALLAIKNEDQGLALTHLEALLQDDPGGFDEDVLEIMRALEKQNHTAFAYQMINDLSARHPDNVHVLFLQAVLASSQHDNETAQARVNRILTLQPDWIKAIIFQAQLAGRNGDEGKAREYLERAVKQNPEDRQLRKLLIELLANSGAYDDALRQCQIALEEKPDDPEIQLAAALIYMEQNRPEKAVSYLEKLLTHKDWEGRASFYLGKIEAETHPERALVWFDRAESHRYGYEAAMAAVSLLMNQKRYDEVGSRVNYMETQYPDQALRTALLKAELYSQSERYQDAYDELTRVLQQAPENRDVLYARALVAEHLDRLDWLEQDLQKILAKDPNDVGALNALGYTFADKNMRLPEAEKYLAKALELRSDEAVIIDSYGWLQYRLGKPDVALDYLRKAYGKLAENEIAAHIAEVLWSMGRIKEAREIYESAYKKSPNDEYLRRFKQHFLQN
jgi:tetratricopeptide (TPR) repeat protein